MARILLVDDDPALREVVRYALTRAGHEVTEATDGAKALDKFERSVPELLVLDVSMPEIDGLEVCRRIRTHSSVPILFLSSRGEELDKVLGLEMGGDDYLSKPFSTRELVSRVKALLRRTQGAMDNQEPERSAAAGIRLDRDAHRAWGTKTEPAQEVMLTVTEFRILDVLVRRPGRVYPRQELVDLAYGMGHHVSDRTLDSHIRRIRQKLREVGVDAIETVHGLGFRLSDAD